jgi:hypothetical protein
MYTGVSFDLSLEKLSVDMKREFCGSPQRLIAELGDLSRPDLFPVLQHTWKHHHPFWRIPAPKLPIGWVRLHMSFECRALLTDLLKVFLAILALGIEGVRVEMSNEAIEGLGNICLPKKD